MTSKFVVIYKYDDGYGDPEVTTAGKIFNNMDMSDCYDIEIASLYAVNGPELTKCEFYGTWSTPEPLRMEIRDAETGDVLAVGYGTDH